MKNAKTITPSDSFLIYTQIFPLLMIITLFTLKVNEKGNLGLSSMRALLEQHYEIFQDTVSGNKRYKGAHMLETVMLDCC